MIDQPTASLTRSSVARVCIEIDLTKPLPNRIWIKCGSKYPSFWQPIQADVSLNIAPIASIKDTQRTLAKSSTKIKPLLKKNILALKKLHGNTRQMMELNPNTAM